MQQTLQVVDNRNTMLALYENNNPILAKANGFCLYLTHYLKNLCKNSIARRKLTPEIIRRGERGKL